MASRNDGLPLRDLLLAEAVKDLESDTPLRDDVALAEAMAAGTDRQMRIVVRARRLADDTALSDDVARLRGRLVALGLALAGLGVALAFVLALTLLGEGRRINALAAIALLVAPNLIGIAAWALLTLFGRHGGAGVLGGAVAALARWQRMPAHMRRVWPAAARVLDAQGLTAWAIGGLNHLLWAIAYAGAALAVAAVLSFSAYRLSWETTILAPQALHDIAQALAWLPERLGLPAQVPAQLDDPDASRLLGRWLIAATLVYGALPRVLLALLCGTVLRARRHGFALDLGEPYYRRLIARFEALAPTQVIDDEHAASTPPRTDAGAAIEADTLAVVGFELPPELALPPGLLARATWSERLDGGIAERQAVLQRLAEHPPARLVLVCHAPSTPDRGTLRFIEAAHAGHITLRLLPDGAAQHVARWRAWLASAERSDIAVSSDAEQALPTHD